MKSFKRIWSRIVSHKHIDIFVLCAAIIGYVSITLSTISKWSIWFDEAFSAYIVRYDFVQIANFTAQDVHPPLYYWVLKAWTLLFGTSDLAFRSLSVLFGILIIVTVFMLVRKFFGKKAAMLSVVFLALSPMMLRMGQETRMYTMVAAIGLVATWVLVRAEETKQKKYWVWYAILVSAGMWTHYFSALIWVGHWAWRWLSLNGVKFKKRLKVFFSKPWIWTHVLAVATFAPWLPFMFKQLTDIQGSGFWIGPVTADSVTNVVTTAFMFLQHDRTAGWPSVLFYVLVALGTLAMVFAYRALNKKQRNYFTLLLSLVIVPIVLTILASMPPLKSSFIERYIFIALVLLVVVYAVSIVYSWKKYKVVAVVLLVVATGSLLFGIYNAQLVGNYNKSTNTSITTKPLLAEIKSKSSGGQPIISLSPWIYYEAAPYETDDFPIYYLNDSVKDSKVGSLAMLQYDNKEAIKDLAEFGKNHETVWVIDAPGDGSITVPVSSWKELQSFRLDDALAGKKRYQAVQYQTNFSEE